ncbi:MAG: hypothetical protein ABI295_00245, partial [Xanthomarina sp.]
EKKVKVTTREEQNIELDESEKNQVNQDIVASPTKVTQTVETSNDEDPFYDTITESVYYNYNDDNYIFKKNGNGFIVSELATDAEMDYGNIMRTSRPNNYFFTSNDYNGIGYFDSNSNFVVEYYDIAKNAIVKRIYTLAK